MSSTPISALYNQNGTAQTIVDTGARSSLQALNRSTSTVINTIYPVGSVFMSSSSTNPGTYLTGTTWARIDGERFLIAAGDTYSAGATNGSFSHTLATGNLPSHSHTFTGTAANTGNQSQGHTHSTTASGGISANHTHSGTSGNPSANHTHAGNSHSHTVSAGAIPKGGSSDAHFYVTNGSGSGGATSSTTPSNTDNQNQGHTHSTTTGNQNANHTHTITTGGISANHTHTVTPAGSIANNGSGNAFNLVPPYLAVYMWKRTA